MDWTLAEIRSNGFNGVRELTGKKSTSNPTDPALTIAINDFYLNRFPHEVKPEELKSTFSQATSGTDTGQYPVSSDVAILEEPATINGVPLGGSFSSPFWFGHAGFGGSGSGFFYQDRSSFFARYPDEKTTGVAFTLTAPTLSIGISNTAAVTNAAFSYRIKPHSYSKVTAETALSGDTVPQSKYGAWRLQIESDGTIAIQPADNNATGYDTAAQAVQDIPAESTEAAAMGFVTAINTGGTFIPGTTALSTGGTVTVTYTDGFNSNRGRPEALLLDGQILYARPIPNDVFIIEMQQFAKPTALVAESDKVTLPEWGPVVAFGTALEILIGSSDDARMAELTQGYQYYLNLVTRKVAMQLSTNQTTIPRW